MKEISIYPLKFATGLPYKDYSFCDGRLYFTVSQKTGCLDLIGYYGSQPRGRSALFSGNSVDILCDGLPCKFEEVIMHPFGIESKFYNANKEYIYRIWCHDTRDNISSIIIEISGAKKVNLIFNTSSKISKIPNRKWLGPLYKKGIKNFYFTVSDEVITKRPNAEGSILDIFGPPLSDLKEKGKVHGLIGSFKNNKYEEKEDKLIITSENNENVYFFFIFGNSLKEVKASFKKLKTKVKHSWDDQQRRYTKIAQEVPKIEVGEYLNIQKFFKLQPLILESIKLPENSFSRSNTTTHWLWGWNITHTCYTLVQSGMYDDVKKILLALKKLGEENPYKKIPWTLTHDFKIHQTAPIGGPEDVIFICDIFRYYSYTRDIKTVEKIYPYAKKLFNLIANKTDSNGLYLTRGQAIDQPEQYGRRRYAYVAFETGWWYEAVRSIENLAIIMNDKETEEKAFKIAEKIKSNFLDIFYDKKTGYIIEAYEPDTKERCDVCESISIGFLTGLYYEDLLKDKLNDIAKFCMDNFVSEYGFRSVPAWEKRGFYEWTAPNTNWWTLPDATLGKIFRIANISVPIEKAVFWYDMTFGWIYSVTEGRPLNKPQYCSSDWHDWGLWSWYTFLLEAVAGIETDIGGFTYIPCDIDLSVKLSSLPFYKSKWDIEVIGNGFWVKEMIIDGKSIKRTYKVPSKYFIEGEHSLKIIRSNEIPEYPVLLKAIGAEVEKVELQKNSLLIYLNGNGRIPIKVYSPYHKVTVNNKEISFLWDGNIGKGEIFLKGGKLLKIGL